MGEVFTSFSGAFLLIFHPGLLSFVALGVGMGLLLGILPGLGGIAGMSILISLLSSFQAHPLTGLPLRLGWLR